MPYLLTIAHASTYGVITGGDPHYLNKTMNTIQAKTKRSVTIELTNRQWALFACALSVGCSQLPPVDAKDSEIVYRTVSEAVFPE